MAVRTGKEPDLLSGQLARDALVLCHREMRVGEDGQGGERLTSCLAHLAQVSTDRHIPAAVEPTLSAGNLERLHRLSRRLPIRASQNKLREF